MLISINNHDYSKNLIPDYDINEHIEYNEWIDGNGHKHKDRTRTYIGGSLNLQFTEKEYINFMKDLESVKLNDLYTIALFVSNINAIKNINAYIEYFPMIKKDLTNGKKYNTINITIEEM